MPTESGKPLIVISYAHADEPENPAADEVKWLSFVTGYLRPAMKHGAVDLWLDRLMPGGANWEREIEQKLRACDIFILLVSRHSLSSDYVVDKEIPIIRERQGKGEDIHFYPLLLTPTPKIALDHVRDKNLRPRDGKPLSDYSINERYRHMSEAADEIANIVMKVEARRRPPISPTENLTVGHAQAQQGRSPNRPRSAPSPQPAAPDEINGAIAKITDRRSLEEWLWKQPWETGVTIAARSALRVMPLVAKASPQISELMGAVFRATAIAWSVGKHPARANELRAAAAAAAHAARDHNDAASAAAAGAAAARATGSAAAATAYAAGDPDEPLWAEVRADADAVSRGGQAALPDAPLWAKATPKWARDGWTNIRTRLPNGEGWNVWIGWYDDRMRGVSRGEVHELIFATVPLEIWDKGERAANAWIKEHLSPLPSITSEREIGDAHSLELWLANKDRRVAAGIAARAALRVAPAVARLNALTAKQFLDLSSAIYRSVAVARVVARVSGRADELSDCADAAADATLAAFQSAAPAIDAVADPVIGPAVAASAFAAADSARAGRVARAAVDTVLNAAGAYSEATYRDAVWEEIRRDASLTDNLGLVRMLDSPLWSGIVPSRATGDWTNIQASWQTNENWDVWIDWYAERLRGGSRGKDYELVFANVPPEEWVTGPAAANAWIKAHLPKEAVGRAELPEPMPGLDTPFVYGWTGSQRVAVVAGAQNLPDYRHFSSEEDHRSALEACRVGGERLLKALRGGRYNARPEYGEALEYYLIDLPKTAGSGNILLANDQARILHAMFLADAAMLSEGFASRLKAVIANQFALNAFYDLVQRHNEAVTAGNWSQPFPLEATKRFFGMVEDNTPRWFEPQVERGLRQVEQAQPPAVAVESEPPPASAIEPPRLPPGTPGAQESWRRQMATAANAVWDTFLQGQDMPVDEDEWRATAEDLGAHIRPILEFLRAQGQRKE